MQIKKWMHLCHILLWFGIGLLVSRNVSVSALLALVAGFCGILYAMRKE